MSIITKLSLRSLRTELSRTIMTILAMSIAATMAVAVLIGLRSVQGSLTQYYLKDSVGQQVAFSGLGKEQTAEFRRELVFTNTAAYVRLPNAGIEEMKAERFGHSTSDLRRLVMQPADLKLVGSAILTNGRLPKRAD